MTVENNKNTIETNWYVITGGPSTGKTTTVNLLHDRGYKTIIEHARHYIDTMRLEGQSTKEIVSNKRKFQLGILDMQLEQEASLMPNEMVFLDRAIPDALAYYRFLGLEIDDILTKALESVSYKKIFMLDRLQLVKDYARLENEQDQIRIHDLICDVYRELRFPMLHVPVLKPDERVDYILQNL